MNVLKKSLVGILIIVIIATMFSINSLATVKGKVNTDTVRVRKEATTDSKIVTLLSLNDEVEITEKVEGWYKVKYKNFEGYVSSEYITLENGESVEEKTIATNQNTNIVNQNINSQNSTNGTAENNTNKNQDNQENGSQEDVNNLKNQASLETLPIEQTIKEDTEVYIIPVINSIAIQAIKSNTKVTVNQYINNWAYITTDVYSGWIIKGKLEDNEANKNQSNENNTNTNENNSEQNNQEQDNKTSTEKVGYINVESTVNLREKASTTSKVVQILTRNTEVKIISEEGEWYQITTSGNTGYVYKKYVSDTKLQATSRSLSGTRKAKVESAIQKETSKSTAKKETTKTTTKKETTKTETTTNLPANTTLGNKIVAFAKKYVGYKYISGGASPSIGFDCSGFTSYVYKQFGVSVSRTSSAQASNGKKVAKSDMQVGDLLIFYNKAKTRVGHVGIYIGGNSFIHSENSKTGVVITSLSKNYYSQRLVSVRRVF